MHICSVYIYIFGTVGKTYASAGGKSAEEHEAPALNAVRGGSRGVYARGITHAHSGAHVGLLSIAS